jgi:hypothetical protein
VLIPKINSSVYMMLTGPAETESTMLKQQRDVTLDETVNHTVRASKWNDGK